MNEPSRRIASLLVVGLFMLLCAGTSKKPSSGAKATPIGPASTSDAGGAASAVGRGEGIRPGQVVRGEVERGDPRLFEQVGKGEIRADYYRITLKAGVVYTIDLRRADWKKVPTPEPPAGKDQVFYDYDLLEGAAGKDGPASLIKNMRYASKVPGGVAVMGRFTQSYVRANKAGAHTVVVSMRTKTDDPALGAYELRVLEGQRPVCEGDRCKPYPPLPTEPDGSAP